MVRKMKENIGNTRKNTKNIGVDKYLAE